MFTFLVGEKETIEILNLELAAAAAVVVEPGTCFP